MLQWICGAALLFVFLTAPAAGRSRARRYRGVCFAHRGLHGRQRPENSLPAFEAACRAGYGVELDVRFSRDGQLIVFHDDTLKRLCGDPRRPEELTAQEIRAMRLPGGERIPTLEEALECIGGRVPLLVEVKSHWHIFHLTRKVCQRLEQAQAEGMIQSFDPRCLLWLRLKRPGRIRGQLLPSSENPRAGLLQTLALAASGLLLNALSRPDFVSYRIEQERAPAPHVQRLLYHTPMAAWTVRTERQLLRARARGDMIIFEGLECASGSAQDTR